MTNQQYNKFVLELANQEYAGNLKDCLNALGGY